MPEDIDNRKIIIPPNPPSGWKSANMLSKDYVGGSIVINKKIMAVRKKKVAEIINAGKTGSEARKEIEKHIGLYRWEGGGVTTYFVSPDIEPELGLTKLSDKPPFPPARWKSPNMLAKDHVGKVKTINKKFIILRDQKIAQLIKDGKSWDEAGKEVSKTYIGIYQRQKGHPSLFANKEAVEDLKKDVINYLPSPPKDWKSANILSNEYWGSNHLINKKLASLRGEKIYTLIDQGFNLDEAREKVSRTYIGMYKAKNGFSAYYASQQAIIDLKFAPIEQEHEPGRFFKKTPLLNNIYPGLANIRRGEDFYNMLLQAYKKSGDGEYMKFKGIRILKKSYIIPPSGNYDYPIFHEKTVPALQKALGRAVPFYSKVPSSDSIIYKSWEEKMEKSNSNEKTSGRGL